MVNLRRHLWLDEQRLSYVDFPLAKQAPGESGNEFDAM
jgi:hypothetical protein